MSERELADQESTVPILAVRALKAAQAQARASGRPVVVLVGQDIVRVSPAGQTILETLPPRTKVINRKKRATQ